MMAANAVTVTVVMPLYNKETDVSHAVQSVLSQTFADFELIVVNDGSTDQGPEIVRAVEDRRIRVFDRDNAGVSAARNRGIEEARANLIAFIDADDEWMPRFLETVVHLQRHYPGCDVFATNYIRRNSKGIDSSPILRGFPRDFEEGVIANYFDVASRSDPPLWSSAVAVTKAAMTSIGGFPVGVKGGEDLLTWARLALRYDIAYSMRPGAVFWTPSVVHDRAIRTSDSNDIVARELMFALEDAEPSIAKALRKYISFWYKVRASICLQLGDRRMALKQTYLALHFHKTNLKLYLYVVLAIMPSAFPKALFRLWNWIRNR